MRRAIARGLVAGLSLVALGAGCSLSTEKPGLLEKRFPESLITSSQLRSWLYDAVLDSADRIKEAADQIREQSREPGIRRQALLWKINGIQACFRAASRRDPLAAYADLWILCRQMEEFFESGAGRDLFGPHQTEAILTARSLETRMEATFVTMFPRKDAERSLRLARERTMTFAQEFPLQSLSFRREPITGHASTLVGDEFHGLGGIVSSVEQDLLTTQRIFTAYMEYLPSIARWEAELLLEDSGQIGVVADALALLKEMPAQLREATTTRLPGEVTRALAALTEERKNVLAGIDDMRRDTLERLDRERNTLSMEIDRQRVATLAQVHDEWKTAVQDLRSAARDGTGTVLSGLRKVAATMVTLLLLVALCSGVAVACRRWTKVPPEPR